MADKANGESAIWKNGASRRTRTIAKGDSRGPKSDTGFSKSYTWDSKNNWVVDDMTKEDAELLGAFRTVATSDSQLQGKR